MFMSPTLLPLKLFTEIFSEADTCTIWNYTITSAAGQKENANERQTFEHKAKMWKKWTKKIGPIFDQFGPNDVRAVLLYKPRFKKPVSTSHIAVQAWFK